MICRQEHTAPGETIECFRQLHRMRAALQPAYARAIERLRGKELWCPGCWGRRPCHGEVFIEWLEQQQEGKTDG